MLNILPVSQQLLDEVLEEEDKFRLPGEEYKDPQSGEPIQRVIACAYITGNRKSSLKQFRQHLLDAYDKPEIAGYPIADAP